jgi:hypothetical protein
MAVRTKEDAARVLSDASGDKRFFAHDGCISSNLRQLTDCLAHMSEESYKHHVAPLKNYFSNWIRHVFGDEKLANDLTGLTNSSEAAKVVKNRIAWLHKKLK